MTPPARIAATAVAGLVTLAAALVPAAGADVRLVSMHYSAHHLVPHLHYSGPVEADDVARLAAVLDGYVHCREECLDEIGGPVAVLTMDSPGGDYLTGLDLADFLRANHIATVVQRGAHCHSACAFAFLGGSGHSPAQGVGTYIERAIEPGAALGFHAPYLDDDNLALALESRGARWIVGDNRHNIAIMVDELVRWGVNGNILGWLVDMGPDEIYEIDTPDDLYLTRIALAPAPTMSWHAWVDEGIRNVCLRLMALHGADTPAAMQGTLATEFVRDIGRTRTGQRLDGFHLTSPTMATSFCAVIDHDSTFAADIDVALFGAEGIGGYSLPTLSFFNRRLAWSTAGTGANPLAQIFQRGAMTHYFLDPQLRLSTLEVTALELIEADRFPLEAATPFPDYPLVADIVYANERARTGRSGNLVIHEQLGSPELFAAARDALGAGNGVTIVHSDEDDTAFIRTGTYDRTGAEFSWIGFMNDNAAAVFRIELSPSPGGGTVDAAELALVRQLECAVAFAGRAFHCG